MNVRRRVFEIVRRTGYELHRVPIPHSLESELRAILRARAIDTLIDIGANEGQFGRLVRDLGFRGRIISFEPGTLPFARLGSARDDDWDIYQVALGEEAGTATLNSFGDTQLSSLHAASSFGERFWRLHAIASETVDVRRLDDLVIDLGVTPSTTFVKIDTQGHDLAVIRGGESTLAHVAGIQIEVPVYAIYDEAPDMLDMLEAVGRLGFAPVGLFPVQRDLVEHLVPIEFDALFVRPDLDLGPPFYARRTRP